VVNIDDIRHFEQRTIAKYQGYFDREGIFRRALMPMRPQNSYNHIAMCRMCRTMGDYILEWAI